MTEQHKTMEGSRVIGHRNGKEFGWFMLWTKQIPGHEGEAMPVFTSDPHEAMRFVRPEMAESVRDRIREMNPGTELFTVPWYVPCSEMGRRLLDAMYPNEK